MKHYREQKKISQTKLAFLCNCGTGTIGGIESGKAKPSLDMLLKIADALSITPADLFIRDVSKNKTMIKSELQEKFNRIINTL